MTPLGVGAIATLVIAGPQSWKTVRDLFHGPTPLPLEPVGGRTWHGWFGEETRDDVVINADLRRGPRAGSRFIVMEASKLFGCCSKRSKAEASHLYLGNNC